MPELPEVETTRRGIEPFVINRRIERLVVRESRLRWPVPQDLPDLVSGRLVRSLDRRSKYLLAGVENGCLIVHLGMSGSLRVITSGDPPGPHDHIDIVMQSGTIIRYRDPRRFGCFVWTSGDVGQHKLLRNLGPEPLGPEFDGDYLFYLSRRRKMPVKNFIMDSRIVVGVGNIYASESLAHAGIHPTRAAGRISRIRYDLLADVIKKTLGRSIRLGGTTLRDFVNPDGDPGYFEQTLLVYGRAGKPCRRCGHEIRQVVIGQRSSFYCPHCQR